MHVYIVRHTSVVLDGNETCYGDMDIDVRPTFEEEASLTRAALEGLSFDGVFSSPPTAGPQARGLLWLRLRYP